MDVAIVAKFNSNNADTNNYSTLGCFHWLAFCALC